MLLVVADVLELTVNPVHPPGMVRFEFLIDVRSLNSINQPCTGHRTRLVCGTTGSVHSKAMDSCAATVNLLSHRQNEISVDFSNRQNEIRSGQ